ncbi:protein-glutamate O-methyltransferase CheR [Ammoniphilus sp. 3BR4]|uniref:CheR family methyltransferase n=1 Tax=Ammoniphilus sp. 3BR4 TaxID=3158265 RepID=UPI0034668A74
MNRSRQPVPLNGREDTDELERMEIEFLLEAIFRRYGFDFRDYVFSSIQRRIMHRVELENLRSVSGLQEKVLHDPQMMKNLLNDLLINVTEMFRDPGFFLSFRQNVVPLLRNYPAIRVWHAGCSTGEEVYSMSILLYEEGLHEKTRIYATDMNESVLKKAKQGAFPLNRMSLYTRNYLKAGGTRAFSEYYSVTGDQAVFHPFLCENVVFAPHNLAVDHSFNEFHVILCRNVMIYFNTALQNRVHDLFHDSLVLSGVLGLGQKENIAFTSKTACYKEIDPHEKLYCKVK